MVKGSFFNLRSIEKLKQFLPQKDLETIIHAFITSCLDYSNSLYCGLPQKRYLTCKLPKMLQRYFLPEKRRNYISPILATLHWLPVKFRIDFKIAVFVYKAVTPKYISDLLIPYSPQRALRSSNQLLLTVPCCRCKTEKGRRSFSSAAPILWNSLPVNVRFAPSLASFKSALKSYLLSLAFD